MSKPPSDADLRAAALRHLERYACSVAGLRCVLQRRVARATRRAGLEAAPAEGAAQIEAVLAALSAAGLLDDARYAEGRVASLARRGVPLQRMRHDLLTHGVGAELVGEAIERHRSEIEADGCQADHEVARAYAKRRRLGVFRPPETRSAWRQKDMAALARAGFSYDVARAIVDGEDS